MDDLLSEKEQIEQIRNWWSEYGGYVIGGLGLGIALLVGFNYYESSKLEAQLQGSVLYESLIEYASTGSLEEAETAAAELEADYASTTYAVQGKLVMARLYMDKNRDQDAADILGEVLASDADQPVKHIARARLARILMYQGKPQEVVDLLEGQDSAAFAATYNELLGDAYYSLGRIEDAQAAYQSVLLDPMAEGTVDQQLVQWKALDLPEQSPEASGEEEDHAEEDAGEELPAEEPASEEPAATVEAEDTE